MSAESKIEWTDKTWNPVVGCTKVSAGCRSCYAKTLHDQRHKAYHAGKKVPAQYARPFETVQLMPDRLADPLSWRKPCKVFVNSVSDLFHEDVPFEFIDRVFAAMAVAKRHTFQILTKRPERMQEYVTTPLRIEHIYDQWHEFSGGPREADAWPLPNVWLGTSVENQAAADARIPHLLATPAAVRFLSCEPLLGPVDLTRIPVPSYPGVKFDSMVKHGKGAWGTGASVDWVIVGGESGPGARPMTVEWARSLVSQCKAAGVACFVKQLGASVTWEQAGGLTYRPRDKKGGDPAEWPADLRAREFPEVPA